MSLLSPTREIYAQGAYMDKSTKSLMNNQYSPSYSMVNASKIDYSTRMDTSKQTYSSKKSPILLNSKRNFLSEAFVRKTIEEFDSQVSSKVQNLRKSQYTQLSEQMKLLQPYQSNTGSRV